VLPPVQTAGALHYQCGGIGTDESTAMRAAMKDYPLSLLFARADGAYEANVDVRITPQGGGDAMQLRAGGPVCLLQLPAGSYRVEVQGAGQNHSRTVQVGRAPQTLDFRF
ncbi:carboxypeptidase regulatory-like domain-containing protein, partial [Diaphorobacter sp. DS2]